ncbi:response regulator transcription factor [Pontibacter sp. E15-1]|uniref:response regulator transcription factor n=1 Tax=Pontibacter sp. E15-1 TaxID=2919918 RepID=UPI001F4FD1A4|nr:response regulator transcription factor [Pontibacter sp. E15-1]MCJ8165365.1 response regulator transcription factor [Pontibacter sp. E15-1]
MKLLIIEDEPLLLGEIENYMAEHGFLCEHATTFSSAQEKIMLYHYDAVVLDITLPDGNGLELLKQLKRRGSEAGVLIVSAKDSLHDKLTGLNLGADDYITKPFHLEELNARINALIRRKSYHGHEVMQVDDALHIDTAAKVASVNGQELTLTKKEYELLLYFVVNRKRMLSHQSIAEHLWGDSYDMTDNYNFVYLQIKNLRKKLTSATGHDYIKTVYGMGYKWATP